MVPAAPLGADEPAEWRGWKCVRSRARAAREGCPRLPPDTASRLPAQAFLTNLRAQDPVEPTTLAHTHLSRGALPASFLTSGLEPGAFAEVRGLHLVALTARGCRAWRA